MEKIESKTFGIEFINSEKIGELKAIYRDLSNEDLEAFSINRPVILPRINYDDKKQIENIDYNQGYINTRNEFDYNNICFHYVKIYSVTSENITKSVRGTYKREYLRIKTHFYVFSKNFKDFTTVTLHQKLLNNSRGTSDFKQICSVINNLNLYIENGFNVKELNIWYPLKIISKYINKANPKENYPKKIIMETISSLEFMAFDDGLGRPGRDDYFWTEYEITNLPKNDYLIDLIMETLSNSIYRSINKDEEKIVVRTKSNTIGTIFWRREKREISSLEIEEMKDILKIGMHLKYSEIKCLFGFMKLSDE